MTLPICPGSPLPTASSQWLIQRAPIPLKSNYSVNGVGDSKRGTWALLRRPCTRTIATSPPRNPLVDRRKPGRSGLNGMRGFSAFGAPNLRSVISVAPSTLFYATKPLPQPTIHATIDAPGKVITHVRVSSIWIHPIHLCNAAPTPQVTNKTKTSVGVEMTRESIIITDFVTDEDGSLKIKRTEEFTDSKVYLDFYQAIAAAKKQ
jgi:hypothetical protein